MLCCVSFLYTGIWSAALDGDLDRVKSMIHKGTDPNLRDSSGYTALVRLLGRFLCSVIHYPEPTLLYNFYVFLFVSTMQVALVILLYASFFLRMGLVHLPRHEAVPHHCTAQLTAVIWMLLGFFCTTGQIQCSVMMMVHPLYIRYTITSRT